MNEPEKLLIPEEIITKRKRKILTDPERLFAKCHTCQEPGNLDNMLRKPTPTKDLRGVELYGAFEYIYFCSDSCQGLFG
jgi:hypothetical protein